MCRVRRPGHGRRPRRSGAAFLRYGRGRPRWRSSSNLVRSSAGYTIQDQEIGCREPLDRLGISDRRCRGEYKERWPGSFREGRRALDRSRSLARRMALAVATSPTKSPMPAMASVGATFRSATVSLCPAGRREPCGVVIAARVARANAAAEFPTHDGVPRFAARRIVASSREDLVIGLFADQPLDSTDHRSSASRGLQGSVHPLGSVLRPTPRSCRRFEVVDQDFDIDAIRHHQPD